MYKIANHVATITVRFPPHPAQILMPRVSWEGHLLNGLDEPGEPFQVYRINDVYLMPEQYAKPCLNVLY